MAGSLAVVVGTVHTVEAADIVACFAVGSDLLLGHLDSSSCENILSIIQEFT
jgi:hypothetical protein